MYKSQVDNVIVVDVRSFQDFDRIIVGLMASPGTAAPSWRMLITGLLCPCIKDAQTTRLLED
jgi:hypothetical protein